MAANYGGATDVLCRLLPRLFLPVYKRYFPRWVKRSHTRMTREIKRLAIVTKAKRREYMKLWKVQAYLTGASGKTRRAVELLVSVVLGYAHRLETMKLAGWRALSHPMAKTKAVRTFVDSLQRPFARLARYALRRIQLQTTNAALGKITEAIHTLSKRARKTDAAKMRLTLEVWGRRNLR
jgi:hypothetical protein